MKDKLKPTDPHGQTAPSVEDSPQPDWDRMGQIAKRLMATPPNKLAQPSAQRQKKQ